MQSNFLPDRSDLGSYDKTEHKSIKELSFCCKVDFLYVSNLSRSAYNLLFKSRLIL